MHLGPRMKPCFSDLGDPQQRMAQRGIAHRVSSTTTVSQSLFIGLFLRSNTIAALG